ncbi:hypothetical protein MJO28_009793 [Puccinia striiformis f. sp. tritici]|uniref:Uncharacterized protein n=1 Tax=Puccinia striiformis f. sp. tritici TaxID=168172 RepID=A0ACC0EA91_9BASI|nr:hypothetical protein MJO28_009793 [Puccinia striiformis f. sp. tritici]
MIRVTKTSSPPSQPSSGSGPSPSPTSLTPVKEMGNVIMKLGSGTFGRVLTSTDVPYAFKAVRRTRNIPILQAEFGWTQAVHNALKGKDFIGAPSAVAFIDGGDPNTLANIPDLFTEDLLEGCNQEFTSVLISDRVYPVSRDLRQKIVESFCPEALKPLHTSKPFIARVYLGRQDIEQRSAPHRFFNTYNFALTEKKIRKLDLPADEYACTMGFLLARLHFIVGTDGRDLEIILGMGDNPTKDKIYVIDCNQFRAFSGGVDDVPNLVDAVITNDPYFPRQGVLLTHMLDAYTTEVQAIAAINGTGDILTIGEHFVTQLGFALKGLSKF